MKATTILKASDINELRSLGSYYDVKNSLEKELSNKLGVNGWGSLFEKIKTLKEIVSAHKEYLSSACEQNSFRNSKSEVSKLLKLRLKARSWVELKTKIKKIIAVFYSDTFDPYEYYEKTKLKKFKNSSKLEGIDIDIPDETVSLENVLMKYRR